MQPDPAADEEELRLGPRHRRLPDRALRLRSRWVAALVVVVAAAVAVPLIVTSGGATTPTAARRSSPPVRPPTSTPLNAPSSPVLSRPVVRTTRRFLLGVHGGWELFGRADRSVVRIEFARGRVTTTGVPALASSGAVSFVAGRWGALVRPFDFVPGYLIPDDRRASEASRHLECGGPALPGPRPSTVWVGGCNENSRRMFLTRLDGTRTGISLRVPAGRSPIAAMPDGRGYVVFPTFVTYPGSPATLDVRPSGTKIVARKNRVIAVGPTRWLLERCVSLRCHAVVVDRSTGHRRELPGVVPPVQTPGTISPDGQTAAVISFATRPVSIELVDLATGALHVVPINADVTDSQPMVWAPNNRLLFALDRHGVLYAVRRPIGSTMALTALTPWLQLPTLRQLAIRPAPARERISAIRH